MGFYTESRLAIWGAATVLSHTNAGILKILFHAAPFKKKENEVIHNCTCHIIKYSLGRRGLQFDQVLVESFMCLTVKRNCQAHFLNCLCPAHFWSQAPWDTESCNTPTPFQNTARRESVLQAVFIRMASK
jgi:hypothetical protein